MATPAAAPATFEIFQIVSPDGQNTADFTDGQFRVLSFDIYENILSPHITGYTVIASSMGAAISDEDPQQRKMGLYSGLPIRAGSKLRVRIKPGLGNTIDYAQQSDDYKELYVTKTNNTIKDPTTEIITLSFTSKIGWLNETTRVAKRYEGRISDSIASILKDKLKLDNSQVQVTGTSNSKSFLGNQKRPLDLIVELASQAVPNNTKNPGFVCYESIGKFNFTSLDELINREPEFTYEYNSNLKSTEELGNESNNFKLATFDVTRDQDLLKQIRSGVYSSKNIFFNPLKYSFTEIDVSVDAGKLFGDKAFSSLGKKDKLPGILDSDFKKGNKFHRIQTKVIDNGIEKEKVTPDDKNNDPELYLAAAATRYNLLFSQVINTTIPCNTSLNAGTNIKLLIESTSERKEQGFDQTASGKYIIWGLRHHFSGENSVTSMVLIRDSYGLHFTKTS
tara:strand:- start:2668 stop:4017 length:1350 start_codon:yes stop_codon:yes gene_type:complete